MSIEPILELVAARPFRKFWIALADGRALAVDGFDCMNIAEDGRLLTLYLPDDDETEIIDVFSIVSLRFSERGSAVSK
jgi:hypothetical protein